MKKRGSVKVIVSVTNDLVTDQRVHKVCMTLTNNGYEVILVGRKMKTGKPLERIYRTKRMRLLFNKTFLFYTEYNIRLFALLLFSKADIFLSNDTDTLIANHLASKLRRKPLVFDAHEMFPEIPEVVNRKLVKSIWTKIEDCIFPSLRYCYTVCQSIADIYNEKYKINMQVVRNIPFADNRALSVKPIPVSKKKVLLYQGAVNIGRGIEWIIDAMPYTNNCIFYIAGDGDILQEMKTKVKNSGLDDKVIFLGRIPFEELSAYTVLADIGMSLLENRGLNYYYSLPNRIFDFIRSEVPVLATDFPEINRIVSEYKTGKLISHYEPQYLASVINKMLMEKFDPDNFSRANRELTWENESKTIIRIMKGIKSPYQSFQPNEIR